MRASRVKGDLTLHYIPARAYIVYDARTREVLMLRARVYLAHGEYVEAFV